MASVAMLWTMLNWPGSVPGSPQLLISLAVRRVFVDTALPYSVRDVKSRPSATARVWVQRWNGLPLMNGAGLLGMPIVSSTLPSAEHLRTCGRRHREERFVVGIDVQPMRAIEQPFAASCDEVTRARRAPHRWAPRLKHVDAFLAVDGNRGDVVSSSRPAAWRNLNHAERCSPEREWLALILLPFVIPGRREAANPESITTIMSMDPGSCCARPGMTVLV